VSVAGARRLILALLVVLFVLHNDLWLWNEPGPWLGLPAGLTYHILYCLVVTVVLLLLVRFAWPALPDTRDEPHRQ